MILGMAVLATAAASAAPTQSYDLIRPPQSVSAELPEGCTAALSHRESRFLTLF
jgi:hypothetical protein